MIFVYLIVANEIPEAERYTLPCPPLSHFLYAYLRLTRASNNELECTCWMLKLTTAGRRLEILFPEKILQLLGVIFLTFDAMPNSDTPRSRYWSDLQMRS